MIALLIFDFAILLRSIEGAELAPGLLIHDEPRQEDMSDEQYERLFNLMSKLEEHRGHKPLFQYIITTGSPPPSKMQRNPPVVLELDANAPAGQGLLFRKLLDGVESGQG